MMVRVIAFLAAFAVAEANAAPAARCADPQSTLDMKVCAEIRLRTADAELTKVYAEAIADARRQYATLRRERTYQGMPDSEMIVRKAQNAWLVYRDANCAHQYQIYYGGSLAGLAYIACKADMTEARIKELRQLMNVGDEP